MKFNFACYALCSLDVERDEQGEIEGISVEILGFWPTREACAVAQVDEEQHRIEIQEDKARKYRWCNWHAYRPGEYVLVPIASMEFDCLDRAEDMITAAAKLIYAGCAVEGMVA